MKRGAYLKYKLQIGTCSNYSQGQGIAYFRSILKNCDELLIGLSDKGSDQAEIECGNHKICLGVIQ